MSGVVLRCPNCGTTRSAPGECDACHEATVRYYCTNHSPGRWVDSRTCSVCGAAFGDAPRAPAPPASAPPSAGTDRAGASRSSADTPSRAPVPRPSPAPAARRDPPGPPPRGRGGWPTVDDAAWERIDRASPPIDIEIAPVGRALGGCLLRLVMLAFFVFFLLFVGIFLLGGSLLGLFVGY